MKVYAAIGIRRTLRTSGSTLSGRAISCTASMVITSSYVGASGRPCPASSGLRKLMSRPSCPASCFLQQHVHST